MNLGNTEMYLPLLHPLHNKWEESWKYKHSLSLLNSAFPQFKLLDYQE